MCNWLVWLYSALKTRSPFWFSCPGYRTGYSFCYHKLDMKINMDFWFWVLKFVNLPIVIKLLSHRNCTAQKKGFYSPSCPFRLWCPSMPTSLSCFGHLHTYPVQLSICVPFKYHNGIWLFHAPCKSLQINTTFDVGENLTLQISFKFLHPTFKPAPSFSRPLILRKRLTITLTIL